MVTWTGRIQQSTDDARYRPVQGFLDLDVASNPFGYYGGSTPRHGHGLILTGNGLIPKGSTISHILLEYTVAPFALNLEPGEIIEELRGELSQDPLTFTTLSEYEARPRTMSVVTIQDNSLWETASKKIYSLPVDVIQEIVNTFSVSNIALFLSENNSNIVRSAYSFDGDPLLAPVLTVDFVPPPISNDRNLIITSSVGGTTSPTPGTYIYPLGNTVFVEATPDVGYSLNYWVLDGVNVGSSNPINVLMDMNHSLQAVFSVEPIASHVLSVNSTPIDGVSFTINGIGNMNYVTPWNGQLIEGNHVVEFPSNLNVNGEIYNFQSWDNGSTNPLRTINLLNDMAISVSYTLATPPPPEKGYLLINGFLDSVVSVPAEYKVLGTSLVGLTPNTEEVDPGIYTVEGTYNSQIKTVTVEVLAGQTIRVDLQFVTSPSGLTPLFPRLREILYPRIPEFFNRVDEIRDTRA